MLTGASATGGSERNSNPIRKSISSNLCGEIQRGGIGASCVREEDAANTTVRDSVGEETAEGDAGRDLKWRKPRRPKNWPEHWD